MTHLEMTDADIAALKVCEIEWALQDLTTLAHDPKAAAALLHSNLEGLERRLRDLRFDLMGAA
jgi:hypothetical protein